MQGGWGNGFRYANESRPAPRHVLPHAPTNCLPETVSAYRLRTAMETRRGHSSALPRLPAHDAAQLLRGGAPHPGCPSKAALDAFSRTLATEVMSDGVRDVGRGPAHARAGGLRPDAHRPVPDLLGRGSAGPRPERNALSLEVSGTHPVRRVHSPRPRRAPERGSTPRRYVRRARVRAPATQVRRRLIRSGFAAWRATPASGCTTLTSAPRTARCGSARCSSGPCTGMAETPRPGGWRRPLRALAPASTPRPARRARRCAARRPSSDASHGAAASRVRGGSAPRRRRPPPRWRTTDPRPRRRRRRVGRRTRRRSRAVASAARRAPARDRTRPSGRRPLPLRQVDDLPLARTTPVLERRQHGDRAELARDVIRVIERRAGRVRGIRVVPQPGDAGERRGERPECGGLAEWAAPAVSLRAT